MKLKLLILLNLFCSFYFANAQRNEVEEINTKIEIVKKDVYNIALLSPMYLDSFDIVKNPLVIPAYAAPGIDFYKGAMIAADSLNNLGIKINMQVIDVKSRFINLSNLIETGKLEITDCIIADLGGEDLKIIANYCKQKKIELISAVSPSDADQDSNPYFIMLQPKLSTHIERIKKHIAQKYNDANILFFNRNIPAEVNAHNYYKNTKLEDNKGLAKAFTITSDLITDADLLPLLNKEKENVIVLGILDPKIALNNIKTIKNFSKIGYNISIYGMPTWDNIKALYNADSTSTNVYFSSPTLLDKSNSAGAFIAEKYNLQMGTTATEIVYKGFESVFYFSNLLNKNGVPFTKYLSDKNNVNFMTPFRIAPAMKDESFKYYENKFLYIAHFRNGELNYE
jgi:hypothetical protein